MASPHSSPKKRKHANDDERDGDDGDVTEDTATATTTITTTPPTTSSTSNGEHQGKDTTSTPPANTDNNKDEAEGEADKEKDTDTVTIEPPITPASSSTIMGCRSVDNFQKLNKIEEGTYGVVYRAKDKDSGEIVALKKLKMDREREGFPMTSLREIKILMTFKHPNIVDVREVVVGNNLNSIFIVMEFVDHDIKGLMEEMKRPFSTAELKTLMTHLLEATAYLHENWVIHRDLKTSNLLYNNKGMLKVADFGLAREYGSPLKPYTHTVVTLWYRAPELLLGQKKYTPAIDMWSIGCIFAELDALLPGRSELDQIDKIFKLLGTANDRIWPGFSQLPNAKKVNFATQPYNNLRQKFPNISDSAFDLLNKLLTYDPSKRLTALEALQHPFFRESPPPKDPTFMPTWPSTHEGGPKKKRRASVDEEMQRERDIAESKNEEERFMDSRDRGYGSSAAKPFVLK